jgi:ubiquinone/menaquinone biosynthesis C-methylase UbiE
MNAYDHFPFADNSFDLVWNYCMFEHFNDVDKLLEEMKRVSRKYILLVTQNSYNYGYPIHRLYHWSNRQRWDHGSSQMMKLGNLKRLFREHGLKISINGCVDVPPFFDTFDMHTRGKIKFFMKGQSKEKWFWSSLQKEDMERLSQDKTIARLQSFERSLKGPFRYLFAHHFFLLGVKDEK